MTPYAIAWTVVAVSGALIGWLVFRALRAFGWLRYVVTTLVLVWAVTPFRFDAEHVAPAFLVAAFRLPFVDEDADPTEAVLVLGSATAGVLLATLLMVAARAIASAARNRAKNIGAPKNR